MGQLETSHRLFRGERVIRSPEYWCKVVGFLQTNYAFIDEVGGKTIVWFRYERGGVMDYLIFDTSEQAEQGLRRNGFSKIHETSAPPPDDRMLSLGKEVPGGVTVDLTAVRYGAGIYSSGDYWSGYPVSKA